MVERRGSGCVVVRGLLASGGVVGGSSSAPVGAFLPLFSSLLVSPSPPASSVPPSTSFTPFTHFHPLRGPTLASNIGQSADFGNDVAPLVVPGRVKPLQRLIERARRSVRLGNVCTVLKRADVVDDGERRVLLGCSTPLVHDRVTWRCRNARVVGR
jgi:hypothetical protein